MKKKILYMAMAALTLQACNNSDNPSAGDAAKKEAREAGISINDEGEKTGEFSFDGKTVTGKVSTQHFGNKETANFSVLCQHNEEGNTNANFELLQITFVNQKATGNPALKIYDGGSVLPMTEPDASTVAVSLSGVGSGLGDKEFTGTGKSAGSITVKNNTVYLESLTLYNRDGDKRTVTAKIPY